MREEPNVGISKTKMLSPKKKKKKLPYLIQRLERWKSRRIENKKVIEKWEDKRYFIFPRVCLIGRMKNWKDEKFICLVEEKNERIEKVVHINLLSCSYYIKHYNLFIYFVLCYCLIDKYIKSIKQINLPFFLITQIIFHKKTHTLFFFLTFYLLT